MFRHRLVSLPMLFLLLTATRAPGQAKPANAASTTRQDPGISDNSFLVEEAYNQEPDVVQHISTFARALGARGWAYTFTQEWPVGGIRHQLSYTIPVAQSPDVPATGVGDVMLNYRLQVVSDEARGIAFSPRLSVSLPTGNRTEKLGLGGTGVQVNLPFSKTLGDAFVVHTNVGGTIVARMPGGSSERQLALGQSLIWLARPAFNVLCEVVWTRTDTRSPAGATREDATLIVPGVRWAWNVPGGLQIVPGVGLPLGLGPSRGTRQLFLYLSFEHPFTRAARERALRAAG